jgi:hypothetical protein
MKFFHSVQARDGGDPPIVIQLLGDQTFLSGRNLVEIWGNITKSALPRPVILPKKGFVSVSESDLGRSIEEGHVLVIAGKL